MGTRKSLSFLEHLDELRGVFVRVIVTLIVGMIACFAFAGQIQEWLTYPFNLAVELRGMENVRLSLLSPTEGFVTHMKIAFFAGMILTSPIVFVHIWRFVAPGLRGNERRASVPLILVASVMFLIGVAFGYHVLRFATGFFLSFETVEVANQWSLSSYIGYVTKLMVAFGIVFQLPLVMYVLSRMGLVTPALLRSFRRHAIISILAFSAMLTPPDPFSQMIMAGPLYLLYEFSIVISWLVYRNKKKIEDGELEDSNAGTNGSNPGTEESASKKSASGTEESGSNAKPSEREDSDSNDDAAGVEESASSTEEIPDNPRSTSRQEIDYFNDDDGDLSHWDEDEDEE